ncbi:hypothetical protein [Streptomyces sp. NBC_00503]|nr:hypothetical protein [Streptomyces sp. NBC_00503]WUD85774.1 hypothetical protein OG490_37405 [Streptomyces sp. NBC_00503]
MFSRTISSARDGDRLGARQLPEVVLPPWGSSTKRRSAVAD